jgi:hypothetical protein
MYRRFLIGLHSGFKSFAGSVPLQFPLFDIISRDGKTSSIPGVQFHPQGERAYHRRNAAGS